MREKNLLVLGLVLIVVAIVGASVSGPGLGGRGPSSMWGHMRGMWGGPGTQGGSTIPGAEEVVVKARDFGFSPPTVTVDAGTPVNITLVNEGDVVHDLTIPELDIQVVAAPEERASLGLTPDRAGEYRFECTVPGHAEAGMVGRFVVAAG
ncbi:MAG TPA: cupredoxin domain-containing protein [Actinomycetota bacterium]|nr:cupredoxin domain-containing protein [Actinomycetota bacterium]